MICCHNHSVSSLQDDESDELSKSSSSTLLEVLAWGWRSSMPLSNGKVGNRVELAILSAVFVTFLGFFTFFFMHINPGNCGVIPFDGFADYGW